MNILWAEAGRYPLSTDFKFIRPSYIVLILCNGCRGNYRITFLLNQSAQTEANSSGSSKTDWKFGRHLKDLCHCLCILKAPWQPVQSFHSVNI